MTILVRLFAIILFLSVPSIGYSVGGTGATCNPSTAAWGACYLAPLPSWASGITNTVNIPGGNYSSPYQANTTNTRYVLQGDITADGTAIEYNASYIVIDLNGYTITYNETTSGFGIGPGSNNRNYIAIRNGSIIQGAENTRGDVYGEGPNPISRNYIGSWHMHISNLYIEYGGFELSGISNLWGEDYLIEENTIVCTAGYGTMVNRHQAVSGIDLNRAFEQYNNVARYNTLVNVQQHGINIGENAEVYENVVGVLSKSTNSMGIVASNGARIYNNTITARGEHPIGLAAGAGVQDVEIYGNYVDVKTTALGDEYSGAYLGDPSATHLGNYAVGLRTTWGADNLRVYNNEFVLESDSSYTGVYNPTGAVAYINAPARGLMIAINSGDTATYTNNTITVLDEDGTGRAYGIACTGHNESDGLFFLYNTVTSNIHNIVIQDEYGECAGYPLFQGNTLIKADDYAAYKTYAQTNAWLGTTARIVDDVYQSGAAETSITLVPEGTNTGAVVNVYFGDESDGVYTYYKQLHDSNNTSTTLVTTDHDPAISLNYTNPGCNDAPQFCSTSTTCISAGWYWSGTACLAAEPEGEIDGVCGSNDGATLSSLTSADANNCSVGTVVNFGGSGPWTWTCQGYNGGSQNNCSAYLSDDPETCADLASLCTTEEDCTTNWPTYNWCPTITTCRQSACPNPPDSPGIYTTDSSKWPKYNAGANAPYNP